MKHISSVFWQNDFYSAEDFHLPTKTFGTTVARENEGGIERRIQN